MPESEHRIANLHWINSALTEVKMSCACGDWSVIFRPASVGSFLPLDEAKLQFYAHKRKKEMQNV